MGAEVTVLNAEPDGTNINLDAGSSHPQGLAQRVTRDGLAMGFAFDGDADRLIAVDAAGNLVDGDAVMGICALQMLAAGTLRNATRLVVLRDGKVVEVGAHEELLEKKGEFYRLVQMQQEMNKIIEVK